MALEPEPNEIEWNSILLSKRGHLRLEIGLSWSIRITDNNTFNGKSIIQIYKDDELRGSFTVDTESEQNDLEWWKSILGEKK